MQSLKQKVKDQTRKKKERDDRKQALQSLQQRIPEVKSLLRLNDTTGRPHIETMQPGLLEAIVDIVSHGAAADDRRQTETMRTVHTLKELKAMLEQVGYVIKESALYLRLLPRRSDTIEGKRHVKTVPVKIVKADNSLHKEHPDGWFCRANNRFVEELASVLGPQQVCYLSQDDKSRVPIGVTAAHKQSTLLMHLEYRIRLPDHDFVKAERHKLIPSVVAGISIEPNGVGHAEDVGYSGPTYISIRSGKHDSSSAATHAWDFERLKQLPEFEDTLYVKGKMKPVVIVCADGGPDENCRYIKVIQAAIHHFAKND